MKKIVATSWHPGGANAIVPVIKLLRAEEKIEVVVIGHEFSESIFQNNNVLYKKISDYALTDISQTAS